ncbi:MAG TPA: MFS transporter, partial [Anaerolineales bacterium]
VMLTFGELTLVPTATKFVADVAPADMRGRYMSLYWVGWGLSRAAAPLIGGAISEHIGPRAIWLGGLAIGLGSALGLILLNGLGWYRQTATRATEAEAWSRAED